MAHLLEHSEATFIGVKTAVSVLGGLFLLVHVRFPRVRRSLAGIVVLYVLLPILLYEAAFNLDSRRLLQNLFPITVLAVPAGTALALVCECSGMAPATRR